MLCFTPPASPEPARHSPEAKPMANGREQWRAGRTDTNVDFLRVHQFRTSLPRFVNRDEKFSCRRQDSTLYPHHMEPRRICHADHDTRRHLISTPKYRKLIVRDNIRDRVKEICE